MSFLAPFFLVGAAAVALPVIFHLIRRTTKEKKIFSSLMFLMPTPPRLTRRSRLEHLLLLALRCLALCLLALGFSRPFFKKAVSDDRPTSSSRRIVVLVDTSASMRRANLWTDARDKVESVLRRAAPADRVAVVAFDRQLKPLVNFEQWNASPPGERAALAAQRLSEISPGWSATHLGNALISAAEMLADTGGKTPGGPAEIVLITDLQEGSRLEALQGYEWPKDVQLSVEQLKPRHAGNAALQLVGEATDSDANAAGAVRVRVSNSADAKREQFKVGWLRSDGSGFLGKPTDVYVPPGQSRIVPLALPESQSVAERAGLQGDDEDFDNTIYVLPPETTRSSVLYFGAETEKDSKQPLYFLERAFQETRYQIVQVLARGPDTSVTAGEVQSATLLVVADALPDERVNALREQLIAGKTVLFVLKSATAASTLARLLQLERLNVEEVRPNGYAMLAEIDFRHPLFAPFADPRYSDFTKIHFWKYRRLETAAIPGARAIAKFDSGDPAILETSVGRGHLLVFTSGWQPDDSQLAVSSKFVPLLYALLEGSGAAEGVAAQYHVGDAVPLAMLGANNTAAVAIRAPDGSELKLAAGETNFSQTMTPGIYTLASTQPPKRFAVNLDAAESRTTPLPADELERLGAPIARTTPAVANEAASKIRLQNAELENRQKLWRWFLVATLAVLLFETWLAGRTARRLSVPEGATT
jgi:hypothetical protein